jgi:uncharacterized membrane protein
MGREAYSEPGDGALGRVTGVIYWYLIVTLLQALTASPGLVALMLLDRSSANAPLAMLCILPIGPALSAALFALRDRDRAEDLSPARSYWRGYRNNVVDVLRLWVPAMLVLAIIALGLVNLDAAGMPAGYGAVLAVIGVLVVLWSLHALVIASLFSFRARDTARLAAHYLGRLPLVTLGVASLLVLAGAVVVLTFDVVLALLGGLWAGLLLNNARRLVQDVQDQFVAPS